jgi:hypothetical protein
LRAGAGSGESPLVSSLIPGEAPRVIVGSPSGGGLSLTVINSAPSATQASSSTISNAFQIVSIAVTKAGLVRETVNLPGPGQLAVKASTRQKLAFRSSGKRKRSATRNATLASFGGTLSGGVHTVAFRLRGAAASARPLVVKLITTYTPTGGSPRSIQRSVTVGRVSKKRHG